MIPGCTCGLHGKALAMTHRAMMILSGCALSNRRLPLRPVKPYIHPSNRGAKAMTIGVAFACDDGLIMGSDRQMTASEWNKYPETKLFFHSNEDRVLAMIGGDELGLAKEVWWEFIQHPITDYDSCKQALMTVLDSKGRLSNDLPLQLLCGIATKTTTRLFEFRGRAVYPVMDEIGMICSGDSSLIHYLSRNIDLFWKDTNDGVVVATYYLKRAEQFIATCHGPMDMIVLKPGPSFKIVSNEVIEALDKRLIEKHDKMFTDLFSLSPPFSILP